MPQTTAAPDRRHSIVEVPAKAPGALADGNYRYYNGDLALSAYNMDKNNMAVDLFIFGYVADQQDPAHPFCMVCSEAMQP